MKTKQKWIAPVIFLFIFGLYNINAQDWPQWQGVNRDGRVADFKAPSSWPGKLTKLWEVTAGFGDASPALSGNKLYMFARQGTREMILCLDAETGKEIWKTGYEAIEVTGPAASHPGPRSTPTVVQGKVYTLGVGGMICCHDANTGKLLWKSDSHAGEVPSFFTAMSTLVTDGLCIAHIGGPENGLVVAFDAETGIIKWNREVNNPTYSSPKLIAVGGKKHIILQSANTLMGLSISDGSILWQIDTPVQRRFYSAASPVIEGDKVIHTSHGDGIKAMQVLKEGSGFSTAELWSNPDYQTAYNTPLIKEGYIYGLSDKGKLFCVNAGNGQTAWADTMMHKNFGSIVDAGPVLMALPSSSNLVVYKPDPKGYQELARYKMSETAVYAHPVVSGNRIFIKDEETIALWTIK